jgi:hypothetical protein
MDTSGGCEPCTFFQVLEVWLISLLSPPHSGEWQFLIFDENRKGYIIEDDCMEILFARYGRYLSSPCISFPL